jgi:zinc protease
MRYLIFTIALFIALPATAQTFGAQSAILKNGMQVVVIPNHRAPVITHMIWYKVGAADEAPGQSGIAHYLEHLLFKGTTNILPGQYSRMIQTMGGNHNAFTSQDYTAFYETLSKDHLAKTMEMEADRMFNLDVPEEHFKSEKAVIIEERRQRYENDPKALFSEQMQAELFINHPYGIPAIGWQKEMSSYSWNDVKAFYNKWYSPNNAILIISGDITMDKVLPLAEKYYGGLPTKDIPARIRPEVPPAIAPVFMTLHHKVIAQSIAQRIYIAPSCRQNKQACLALQVLEEVMDGGATTRLYKSLVVDQKKASSVQLSYYGDMYDYGTLSIGVVPVPGVSLDEAISLIDDQINDVIQNGVSDVEVKEAIQRLQDAAVFARDSISGPAMIFGYALATGSTVDDIENWTNEIAAITPAQVQDAAKTYLSKDKPWLRPAVTGYMLPEKEPDASVVTPNAVENDEGTAKQ